MTPDTDLEQRLLVALLDGWVALDEATQWGEAATVEAITSALVERSLIVRGSVGADGFSAAPEGRWLKRTRAGELRGREVERLPPRGFTPRKKNGRCG